MIKYIKIQNMISNDEEIIIDFNSKYHEEYKDDFFEYSIKDKNRSDYKQATLKTIGIIGQNAAYKTSTLLTINKILDFLLNFENNLRDYLFKSINVNEAMSWYHKVIQKDPFDIGINQVLEKYWKHLNKEKHIHDMKDEYIEYFYKKNCFNKNKKIYFEIQFDKKDLNIKVNLNKEKDNFIYSITLNDKNYDILNSDELKWFNYDFFSIASNANFSLKCDVSLNYLYNKKLKKQKDKLLLFLQKLDSSIIDIKITNRNDFINILHVTREYNGFHQDISINKLSTGTKLFLVYLYRILKNDFIIFDEIENALHFKLVELLLDIAKQNNKQVIFSTHSPFIVQNLLYKFQIYIYEITNNQLTINLANKLFRDNESIPNKYLHGLVSNPDDLDLDFIRMELY